MHILVAQTGQMMAKLGWVKAYYYHITILLQYLEEEALPNPSILGNHPGPMFLTVFKTITESGKCAIWVLRHVG